VLSKLIKLPIRHSLARKGLKSYQFFSKSGFHMILKFKLLSKYHIMLGDFILFFDGHESYKIMYGFDLNIFQQHDIMKVIHVDVNYTTKCNIACKY